MSEDFPKLIKDTKPQNQAAQLIPSMINKKKANLRYISMIVQNSKT